MVLRVFRWLVALLAASGCGACGTYLELPVIPPQGILFSSVKAPLSVHVRTAAAGSAATKSSQSSTSYIRDILITGFDIAWDDAAVADIARRGGISTIAYADYELLNVLGVYRRFTINVYGE